MRSQAGSHIFPGLLLVHVSFVDAFSDAAAAYGAFHDLHRAHFACVEVTARNNDHAFWIRHAYCAIRAGVVFVYDHVCDLIRICDI